MDMLKIDKKKIEEFSRKYQLLLLILHGSHVKGTNNKQSDIDLGLLGSSTKIMRKKYLDIFSDLADIFGDKADPAILNNAEPLITYQTALNGQPLYEKRKGLFQEFKLQSISRYQDAKKFRELEKAYIKRAVANGWYWFSPEKVGPFKYVFGKFITIVSEE